MRTAGCEKIHQDRISGAKGRSGPAWPLSLEKYCYPASAPDRLAGSTGLGRSLHDLILLGALSSREAGVGLMSVQEKIDTSSSGGKLVFHMFGAFAEFERNLVRERTQAGLNAARARDEGGRPKVLDPAKRQLVVKLYAEKKHTIGEICRMMGISKPTLYNYLAEASA